MTAPTFAPGLRIECRDAEWVVRRVDVTSDGGYALQVQGLSEIVRNKSSVFLTKIEGDNIQIVEPAQTQLVPDETPRYRKTRLFIESMLRQTVPPDDRLYIGYAAAMTDAPYQLDPALQALKQPRQRILLADFVGLGKTIEVGVLLSELIRRGRGKRILVLAIRSMMTQFQKEIWTRFSIPLVRLDSVGIRRIRRHIPTNANPFYYFDKAIISIDTLKNDREYRTYLEECHWDIIVIDEAQNVALRGGSESMRARLARLLRLRSDTLILASATPHDGRPESFATLMNMLDPTAIANPKDYGPDDIRGLYVRRFKKDVHEQVAGSFKEREIHKKECFASATEETAFEFLSGISFKRMDRQRRSGVLLFKTQLEKSLFSSPSACLETISHRIITLEKDASDEAKADIRALTELARLVKAIDPKQFSKYQLMLHEISTRGCIPWSGRASDDRLVIFTERLATMGFLQDRLTIDLKLNPEHVRTLTGQMSDVEQQDVVEKFGQAESPIRLLIASDVASEGINLHFQCAKLVHFDIPWSLMTFQQRNGRIDRFGQERDPHILYLLTRSNIGKIRGDMRILEVLIRKDEQAMKNIGDPSSIMARHDEQKEEEVTASAIESGQSAEEFEKQLDSGEIAKKGGEGFDFFNHLFGKEKIPTGTLAVSSCTHTPTLFKDDRQYLVEVLNQLPSDERPKFTNDERAKSIDITINDDLDRLLDLLPPEVYPEDNILTLTTDKAAIEREIRRARTEETCWPRIQYLWGLHPLMTWAADKALYQYRRNETPVVVLQKGLEKNEAIIVCTGNIPNRQGQPVVERWFGLLFRSGKYQATIELEDVLKRTGIDRDNLPNPNRTPDLAVLKALFPEAVATARKFMRDAHGRFQAEMKPRLDEQMARLAKLRESHNRQLEFEFKNAIGAQLKRKQEREREIDRNFTQYQKWIEETMTIEAESYIKIAAVFTGVA